MENTIETLMNVLQFALQTHITINNEFQWVLIILYLEIWSPCAASVLELTGQMPLWIKKKSVEKQLILENTTTRCQTYTAYYRIVTKLKSFFFHVILTEFWYLLDSPRIYQLESHTFVNVYFYGYIIYFYNMRLYMYNNNAAVIKCLHYIENKNAHILSTQL